MCNIDNDRTVKGWITDGSPVVFSDTIRLKTKTKEFIGHRRYFEGIIDSKIKLGECNISWQDGGHDAELEWVLVFKRPITETIINGKTDCILQGMIEGKNLQMLLGKHQIPWAPASIGNNVISTRDGDRNSEIFGKEIKLGALGEDKILATMKLTYTRENGMPIKERVVHSNVLKDLPIIDFLNDLKSTAASIGFGDGCIINARSMGRSEWLC